MSETEPSAKREFPDIDLKSVKTLRQLVLRDELTDLYNRRYLTKLLKSETKKSARRKNVFSLMFMDVDNFKKVNDTHGHLCGDKVLVELGRILRECVRAIDVVCRYAGDEFVVVLPDAEEKEAALVAQRITATLAQYPWSEKGVPTSEVTLSIGLAFYPRDGADLAGLVDSADKALYAAKSRGRNLLCSTQELTAEEEILRLTRPAPIPKFVGREKERGRMAELLERSSKGEGALVLIGGEAGVGKTRFVSELETEDLVGEFTFLSGVCREETRAIPYFPFREAFALFFEADEESLKYYRSLKGAYRSELAKFLPQIEDKPSVEHALDRYRLFEAIRSLLSQASQELPVFLFLDDLHWADEASLDLLHYLARGVSGERIVICGTFRQEELAEAKGERSELAKRIDVMSRGGLCESMDLTCLSQTETSSMIDSIFPDMSIPADFKETVYSKTDGNPFFVEEVVRSVEPNLAEKGFEAGGTAEVLRRSDVPWSIKGVIEDRMDGLDEKEREILSRAALLGKKFNFDILLHLSGVNEGHLLDVVDRAQKIQLIREDQVSEGNRFTFKHSLIADVLYGGMSRLRKKVLHRRAGEVMEIYYSDKREDVSEELGRHFWEGGSHEKAALYSRLAGDRAKELYANDEAVHLYTRALQALDRVDRTRAREETRFDILNGRQAVYGILGRKDNQKADLEDMIQIAQGLGDHKRLSDGYIDQSAFHVLTGEYSLAKDFAEKALKLKKEVGDKSGEGTALMKIGMACADLGENQQALDYHRQALEAYRENGDKGGEGMTLLFMGIVWYNLGEYRKALHSYEQSLRIFGETGERRREGAALCNIGVVHCRLGDYEEGLRCYKAHLDMSRKLGDLRAEAADLHNIGTVTKDSGSYEEALTYCQQALDVFREIGDRREEGNCLADIGDAYHELGDYKKALTHHQEALRVQREIGNKDAEGYTLNDLGHVYESLGDWAKALDFHKKALSLGEETGSKYIMVSSKNSLSRIHREMGGEDELNLALKYAVEATELSEEVGLSHGEIQGLSNQGMAHLSLGNIAQALKCSEKAASLLEERGQIEGSEEEIYFNHFKVLREKGDERKARGYLKRAHDEVRGKATRIKNRKLRNAFLKKVKLNQEIAEEWNRIRRIGSRTTR